MSDFKKLRVWRKAHALTLNVHRVAGRLRGSGSSNLRNQMTRAAASIPTNIVEGRGQKGEKEFARFVRIAINSSAELEYHLILARDTRAIAEHDVISLLAKTVEVRMMMHGLLTKLSGAQSDKRRAEGS